MKLIALIACLTLGSAALVQDMPKPAERLPEHVWLQQLVGEWDMTAEATMAPGTAPVQIQSTESVRSIGGLWILGEGTMDMGGQTMTTLLTVGYDPARKAFVGTWIDSIQTHMWNYVGKLDTAKRVLSLDADGPAFDDPTKTASYRDAIEIVDADHKVLTSSVKNPDGTWTQFMRAQYTRRK